MIATNRLPSSVLTIFLFWYVVFFIPLGLRGIPIWDIVQNLPISAALALLGGMTGFGLVTMASISRSASDEDRLWSGDRHREAVISLGAAPWSPVAPRRTAPAELLNSKPWWTHVQARSPEHAAAIKAVLDTMYVIPKLPASPYPGGHRGRTLIEHSLAVVDHMLVEVRTWTYEGQFDKRGNLRVPLADPDTPHRFQPSEVPLLILTALAHDIGKMTCYVPVEGEQDEKAATVKVVEAYPNHDAEGARLLRMIPEVMDLPFDDRTALITACGYYHHPFAIPNAEWVTDRMRSLTELLAHADIQTGISEGHTLTADVQDGYAETLEPGQPSADALPPAEALEDDDLDAAIALAAKAAKPGKPSKAATTPAGRPATAAAHGLPRELRMFMESIRRPGAINGIGTQKNNRIAWKHGDYVYVIDSAMRAVVMNQNPSDLAWLAKATETASGNAAPFTAALAEQLHEEGALMVTFQGRTFSPRRALFKMASKGSSRTVPVLVVRASFIPGADGVKDAEPITLTGPFWGDQSGRDQPQPTPDSETLASLGTPGSGVETQSLAEEAEDLSVAPPETARDDTDLVAGATDQVTPAVLASHPVEEVVDQVDPAVLAARQLFAAQELNLDDLGIDLPPLPASAPPKEQSIEQPEDASSNDGEPAPPPTASDVADYFIEMIQSSEFRAAHTYAIRRREGVDYALLPLDESSGEAVSRALDSLREIDADLSGIKVAGIQATGQQAYVFKLPS